MSKISGAQMLVRTLEELGVSHIFGYPGGAILNIYDTLMCSEKITHVMARTEQGACHMADGYARASGKVGCALVNSGPGATNALTAIATANADSIPLVVLTGQVDTNSLGTDAFQEVDTMGITRPVVKHSFLCQSPLDIPKFLRQAFYIASSGRPGPVVVDLPKNCVDSNSQGTDFPPLTEEDLALPTYNPTTQGHKGQIRRAIKQITRSHRPIVLVGGGAISGNASESLNQLLDRFNLPVACTLMGLGTVPTNSPRFLGMVGLFGSYQANTALSKCDLILAIGVRFDQRVTNDVEKFCPDAKIIHIDIDPSVIAKLVPADLPIVGDTGIVLKQMLEMADEVKAEEQEELQVWWEYLHKLLSIKNEYIAHGEDNCHPALVVQAIAKASQGKGILATDSGQHQLFAASCYPILKPRSFISSCGFGTPGFGFPAAIGAKVARPDEPVILITGDSSFQVNIQELATCMECNIPLKIFILNNHALGMLRQLHCMYYQGRSRPLSSAHTPDFVALAQAYGHKGFYVDTPKELDTAIQQAFAEKEKLVVVEINCDANARVLPMQKNAGAISDMLISEHMRKQIKALS